jgi:menaquinone-dependent protoporphyrinogen oxidase
MEEQDTPLSLVLFSGTTDKLTAAAVLAVGAAAMGRPVDVFVQYYALDVEEVRDVEAYDGVIVGSAVYYGRWLKPASEFVHMNRAALAERPVWLFSSGPLGEQPSEELAQVRELREAVGPRDYRVFSGALDRSGLGFGERLVARAVRAPEGDFRRWDEIDAWVETIAGQLGAELPAPAQEVAKR